MPSRLRAVRSDVTALTREFAVANPANRMALRLAPLCSDGHLGVGCEQRTCRAGQAARLSLQDPDGFRTALCGGTRRRPPASARAGSAGRTVGSASLRLRQAGGGAGAAAGWRDRAWVLPNPSALNAHYGMAQLTAAFAELRRAASDERGVSGVAGCPAWRRTRTAPRRS